MVTDARDVFTTIDATEMEADVIEIPVNEDESVQVERQNISGDTLDEVIARDRSLAESTLLDARDEEGAQVSDGETVDAGGRRLLIDGSRVGYAVIWQELSLEPDNRPENEEDSFVKKHVAYVVTDPTAIR